MQFYRLKAAEMDTLPYWEFENKNYPSHPGRSYSHQGVLMLVSRKHAMLAGLHEKGLREHELLRKGKELFDHEYKKPGVCMFINFVTRYRQERLLQRTPDKKRKPHLWKIVNRHRYVDPTDWESTPNGSWETPIWEHGKIIGHWLNYQFDPNIGPEDDWMFSEARFRPLGSSKRVELP